MQQSNYCKEVLVAGLAVVAGNINYSAAEHGIFLARSESNLHSDASTTVYTPVILGNEPDKMSALSVADVPKDERDQTCGIRYATDAEVDEAMKKIFEWHGPLLKKLAE